MASTSSTADLPKLSDRQRAVIERNRQHALLLRQARIAAHPYLKPDDCVTRYENSKLIDTGGGFYIEAECTNKSTCDSKGNFPVVVHPIVPPLFQPPQEIICLDCEKKFEESFLLTNFDVSVCNQCRDEDKDEDDKHALITKSEAKLQYLLKDVDLEAREPKLKFILRKNPHNDRWGSMKLFLQSQVEERAIEVWGSEELIEEEREKRGDKREASRRKKFEKSVKELRMAVRSSTYTKDLSGHKHEFSEEVYDEEEDMYSKTCTTCGYVLTYEQM